MDPELKNRENKWGRRLLEIMTIPYKRGKKNATIHLDHEYELLLPRNAKSIKERYIEHPGPRPRYSYYRIDVGLLREHAQELNMLRKSICPTPISRTQALAALRRLEKQDPEEVEPVSTKQQARLVRGLYMEKIDEQQTKINLLIAAKEKRQRELHEASKQLYGDVNPEEFQQALREMARFLALKNYRSQELSGSRLKAFTHALTAAYEALEDLGFAEQTIFVPPVKKTSGSRFLNPEEQLVILDRVAEYINEIFQNEMPCAFKLSTGFDPARNSCSITYESEDGLTNQALLKIGVRKRRLTINGRGYSIQTAVEHELNTHLLRTANGIANDITILEFMPNYGFTEEGLAVYKTALVGGILDLPPGLREPKKSLPIILMGADTVRPHTFKDLFDLAVTILYPGYLIKRTPKQALHAARNSAYGMVYRAKRGTTGGFAVYTKDLLYYDGVRRVEQFVQRRGEIPDFLFAGKVDLRHEQFLKACGLDKPPLGKRFDIPSVEQIAKEVEIAL